MSEERGPNYDWKHEAEQLRKRVDELEMKLRDAQAEAEYLSEKLPTRYYPRPLSPPVVFNLNKAEDQPTLNSHPPVDDGSDEAF